MTAGVLLMQADFTALNLYRDRVGAWEEGLNIFRKLAAFIGGAGITLAPSPRGGFSAWRKIIMVLLMGVNTCFAPTPSLTPASSPSHPPREVE